MRGRAYRVIQIPVIQITTYLIVLTILFVSGFMQKNNRHEIDDKMAYLSLIDSRVQNFCLYSTKFCL